MNPKPEDLMLVGELRLLGTRLLIEAVFCCIRAIFLILFRRLVF